MRNINLHDATILNIIINPVCGFCQFLIATELEKIIVIEIDEIRKIDQSLIDCLSMFFNGEGNIDYCSLEKKNDLYELSMRGLVNPCNCSFTEMSWRFTICARKISISEKKCTENEIDRIVSLKSINLFDCK